MCCTVQHIPWDASIDKPFLLLRIDYFNIDDTQEGKRLPTASIHIYIYFFILSYKKPGFLSTHHQIVLGIGQRLNRLHWHRASGWAPSGPGPKWHASSPDHKTLPVTRLLSGNHKETFSIFVLDSSKSMVFLGYRHTAHSCTGTQLGLCLGVPSVFLPLACSMSSSSPEVFGLSSIPEAYHKPVHVFS